MDKAQTQDYYIEAALIPEFMNDEEKAEEAVKTVLGIFASILEEEDAREFSTHLPEYLTYENLRGHQENPVGATPGDCVDILVQNMDLESAQAQILMMKIIAEAKAQAAEQMEKVADKISDDWQETIVKA